MIAIGIIGKLIEVNLTYICEHLGEGVIEVIKIQILTVRFGAVQRHTDGGVSVAGRNRLNDIEFFGLDNQSFIFLFHHTITTL